MKYGWPVSLCGANYLVGLTLDRLFQTPEGQDPPDIQELIDALVNGDPTDSYTQQQDPLSMDSVSKGAPPGAQAMNAEPDPEGYISGRAAEFATPKDLHDFAHTGSLKTGDPGVGAWGDVTSGNTPGVAVPRNWLSAKYGSEDAAKGKSVQIISPSGVSAVVPILDKGPRGDHRANNAVVEVNPAAKKLLGAGDSSGWRYKLLD